MKINTKKKITISLTLDSSETIMFTKGGMHKIAVNPQGLFSEMELEEWELKDKELEITIQMEHNEQGRFDFLTGESEKHKQRVVDEAK